MPATTLSTLENQDNAPRGEVLQRLAEYFKVPVSYFFMIPTAPPKSSDAAREWLQSLRQPAHGKDTIATQATDQVDDATKERIARAIRKKHNEISDNE
jgi:transcriptional regulator with XRE-family HTH domain